MPPEHVHEVLIRESHLDSFGHMNNAAYLVLFEEARWELITRNGYGYGKVKETRKGPIVLELTMKFRKEITLRERIRIMSRFVDYKGRIGRFHQEMRKEDGTLAAELDLVMGLFDLETRKLIDPTPEWRQGMGPGTA